MTDTTKSVVGFPAPVAVVVAAIVAAVAKKAPLKSFEIEPLAGT